MIAFALNPGLLLLLGAALVLVCTRTLRMPIMLASTIGAVALSFVTDFGAYSRFAQIGLEIVPLQLDPLSQVFGLSTGLAAIILALASAPTRDRWRDGALLAASGGSAGAIYSGDLVSFTAYLETASLAVAALVFCGGGARARGASIQVLAWQACAGACLATGAGLTWGATGINAMSPMALNGPGPALFLLGLLVKAGAAPAHAWLRVSAGASGGIALAAIQTTVPIVALYALVRCFGGLPALVPIGGLMVLYPALLAAVTGAPRVRMVYVAASLLGLGVIGAAGGGPLGLAGACALAFALCLGIPLMVLSLEAMGGGRDEKAGWVLRGLALLGAASILSVPGTAGYAATSLLLDGLARDGALAFWLVGLSATVLPLLALRAGDRAESEAGAHPASQRGEPAAFSVLLAMGVAAFFILVVGVDSRWLYALLPPGQLLYSPYDGAHLVARGQILCAAGLVASLVAQVQKRRAPSGAKVDRSSSGDVFDWVEPICRSIEQSLQASAAWRARTRKAVERGLVAFGGRGFAQLRAGEAGIFREILGPGMVLVLAAGLALGLLLNGG